MSANNSETGLPGSRRRLLYAGVAGAAAIAGAGLAWWKWRPEPLSQEAAALWALSFDTPAGSTLAMQSLRGKPLVVNFWATWCPPCVDELPLLDQFFRQNAAKGWQVIGLAIDQPGAVRTFLERTPISFPVGLAGMGGAELSKELGNAAGGLPFTVVLGSSGQVLQRRIGRVKPTDLDQWARLG
ncbi:MAG TPA: TlpA disulfide reductase family protein [Ramlibacter sp.]|nr:TlpA disulfide reductase family protein [Ramlibacter sp.]